MSADSKEFLHNYAANERIWHSVEASSDEKAAAWRQQELILQHLTHDFPQASQHELMEHHYNKLETKATEDYLNARVHAVHRLLQGYQPNKQQSTENADEFPTFDISLFETPCHGAYESCRHDEITAEQLQLFNKQTTSTPLHTETKSARNTIQNFLQPLPQAPTLQQQPKTSIQTLSNNNAIFNINASSSSVDNIDTAPMQTSFAGFRSARDEQLIQNAKKYGIFNPNNNSKDNPSLSATCFNYGAAKKSLGGRRNVRSAFVPPVRPQDSRFGGLVPSTSSHTSTPPDGMEITDERLINIEPKMIELITNEIMHKHKPISWDDIAGLEYAKATIKEAVVYPLLRPDIFTGLRRPPRGILLFGPPGTGKTLIGKCIASQSHSTFFSISASSLTSKWIGDGEKMVRALFAVAAVHQPSVVFIDEIDSLLSQRSDSEHESSRRLKTEFLVQLDGAATSDEDRILIVGATNRPQELDDAARRRLVKRLYIPLPTLEARLQILRNLLQTVRNSLSAADLQTVAQLTDSYSGADMESLCREASLEPIRSIPADEIPHFKADVLRAITSDDFHSALQKVRPSVSTVDLKQYTEWNHLYGAEH